MKIQKGISLQPVDQETKITKLKGQMRDASQMYEQHFLNQMVKSMRTTVNREEGMLKPNFAEKIFSEQLDGQYVEGWTKKGGIGLADMIYDQLAQKLDAGLRGHRPKGALPIAPKQEPMGIPSSDSIKFKALPSEEGKKSAEYRFEISDPSGAPFEAQVPMSGKVIESKRLDEGWKTVRLDHGQGLTSELTFPGSLPEMSAGTDVQSGLRLGILDSKRPVLAWKLEWT